MRNKERRKKEKKKISKASIFSFHQLKRDLSKKRVFKDMQASIAYVSKFKQSIAFLIHEQARKSITRRQGKTKLHRDVEFDQENNTIKKRKKMQEFYLK